MAYYHKIHCKYTGIKGIVSIYEYGLKQKYMITEKAKRKVRILEFWRKYGLKATIDAYGVGRSILFVWKKRMKEGDGKIESLNEKSKVPKNRRKRIIEKEVAEFIIKSRKDYPMGKDKIADMMKTEGISNKAGSTVGRIIEDLKRQGKIAKNRKVYLSGKTGKILERKEKKKRYKQRRKGYQPKEAGDLIQVDTISIFIDEIKRYIVTAIDLKTDFAFAYSYKNPTSKNARDFFKKMEEVAPFKIKRVQTDNGSEFEKYFREYVEAKGITHYHNYPRCPKMNAYVERFNRTIQEEFATKRKYKLAYDLEEFNRDLMEYLIWYNTKRPHWGLNLKTPMSVIINQLNLSPQKSNMLWTYTISCKINIFYI